MVRVAAVCLFGGLILISAGVQAGDVNVGVHVSGELQPGVYGQIDLGNRPPPPLIYTAPVLMIPGPTQLAPVYLHVPPGHAKHWGKHCHRYNACGVPVYFVRSAEYEGHDDEPRYPEQSHRGHGGHGGHEGRHGHKGH